MESQDSTAREQCIDINMKNVERNTEGNGEEVTVTNAPDEGSVSTKPWSPDGGWGWMIVLGSTITHFILVGVARSLGVVYILLRERFQSSATETAMVAAVFNTMRSITAPVWGMLCDRFSCRIVTAIGAVILASGFIISSFGDGLLCLIFSFGVVSGTGGAMVFTSAYIMVGQYFDKKKGRAMGFSTLGSGLGQIVLAPSINALAGAYGFSGTLLILGGMEFNNLVSAALYRPLRKETPNTLTTNTASFEVPGNNSEKVCKTGNTAGCCTRTCEKLRQVIPCFQCDRESLWRNSRFISYCLLISTMQSCIVIFLVFSPSYARHELGVDKDRAALLVSIFGFADVAGRFLFAFLFDLKQIRTMRRFFYVAISIAFGILVIITASMPTYISCCVMSVFAGLFEGGVHSQRATILSEFTAKDQQGTSIGFLIFSQGVGNMYGPTVAGLLRDTTGNNSASLYFAGLSFTLAATVFFATVIIKEKAWHKLCKKNDNI